MNKTTEWKRHRGEDSSPWAKPRNIISERAFVKRFCMDFWSWLYCWCLWQKRTVYERLKQLNNMRWPNLNPSSALFIPLYQMTAGCTQNELSTSFQINTSLRIVPQEHCAWHLDPEIKSNALLSLGGGINSSLPQHSVQRCDMLSVTRDSNSHPKYLLNCHILILLLSYLVLLVHHLPKQISASLNVNYRFS